MIKVFINDVNVYINFIILDLDRIIVSKTIDVIKPFIIAMVIIKDTGQSIS